MYKRQRMYHLVRSAVAMAMGVAVVVLAVMKAADTNSLMILLGIGVFLLGLDALDRDKSSTS